MNDEQTKFLLGACRPGGRDAGDPALAAALEQVERDPQLRLIPIFPEAMRKRSQDLPPLFGPVGAIWWAKAESLRQTRNFYMRDHTGWEIPWERAVDIDTEEDWRMAELLKQRKIEDVVVR
jgi:N-acylneuraminate cytidylyltransferase